MSIALPDVVSSALVAANNGDSDGFLAAFTADGVVDDWGREFQGLAAIRRWSDKEFIGVQVSLAVTGVTRDANTVTVAAEVGGNGFNGPSHFAFQLSGDRVARMTIAG
jgi:hypothetical protein